MAQLPQTGVDPRSGFCKSNSTFYSKRKPLVLPTKHFLDITTFITSQLLTQHHNDNKVAFIDASTGRNFSFADVGNGVESVSTCLSEMGIRKGDVVLLLSPNSIFFPIVCLSVMSLGAIITPANPLNTAPEMAKQMLDSKATLVFTIPSLLPKLSLIPVGKQPINVVLMSDAGDPISIPYNRRIVVAGTLENMMKKKEGVSGKRVVSRERVTQDERQPFSTRRVPRVRAKAWFHPTETSSRLLAWWVVSERMKKAKFTSPPSQCFTPTVWQHLFSVFQQKVVRWWF